MQLERALRDRNQIAIQEFERFVGEVLAGVVEVLDVGQPKTCQENTGREDARNEQVAQQASGWKRERGAIQEDERDEDAGNYGDVEPDAQHDRPADGREPFTFQVLPVSDDE